MSELKCNTCGKVFEYPEKTDICDACAAQQWRMLQAEKLLDERTEKRIGLKRRKQVFKQRLREDECPCGSGQLYKYCCGMFEDEPTKGDDHED
jgi:uncharacterized protein YecA (UPF0149 family)